MRWVKHLTMAHADRELGLLCEEFGAEAYGVYWLIVEDIAGPMEAGKMETIGVHSVVRWSQICHCSARRWRSIVARMAEKNLIDMKSIDDRIQIDIPNILKYKDEYSKKSGQTQEQEREQKQKESKEKTDTPTVAEMKRAVSTSGKPPGEEIADWFETQLWPSWIKAKNDSKGAALKAAKSQAKTPSLRAEIMAGAVEQSLARSECEPQRRSYCATWLNQERWRDGVIEPQPQTGQVSIGLVVNGQNGTVSAMTAREKARREELMRD